VETDEYSGTMRHRLPRGRLIFGLLSLFAMALIFAAALPRLVPPASASTQVSGSKITPAFPDDGPRPPAITATAAFVIDVDSGRILYSRNANARVPMASTTKMMTAVVALESLTLDTNVTISGNAAATIGSSLRLKKGQVLAVKQLMYALLVSSANDAAVALAEASAGSTQAFVAKMNDKARALGLSNTHFANVSGLNAEKHFSSARDLAILAQYAMLDPVVRRIVRTREYTLPDPANPGIFLKHENHNLLLGWQDWVTGVKTGSTPYAKYCLVASGTRDGVSLISVLLGAAEDDVRWKESKALLKYGFSLYSRTVLADKGEMAAELAVPDGLDRRVRLVADRSLVVSLFKTDVVESSVRVDRDVVLPVQSGDVFGTMEFTLDGKSLGSVSLIAAQPVENVTIKMILDYWRDRWLPNLALGDLRQTTSSP
jgi:D-alanyl-D-alanine carboxypeptidase (penicillin-binding protein 5/6)